MKLTYFSEQTMPKGEWGKNTSPAVTFSKSGIISINKAGVEQMKIKKGDKFSFAQDDDHPENWYLFKDPDNGFAIRETELNKSGTANFNHSALVKSFIESLSLDTEASHRFKIATQPTQSGKTAYWGILIAQS